MTPEDLWLYKRFCELGDEAHRLPGDQHLPRLQVPPEGNHHRHAGLDLRAPGRAVLDGGALGAEQGSRHHRLQVDRLVPRPPARRRPEAAASGATSSAAAQAHVDWQPFHHPQLGAVEIGGWDKMNYWRNPPPQLREREAARFPGLDDADRAVAAEAGAAAHRGARAGPRHLARALRGGQQRLPAGLREQAGARTQGGARRGLRDPPARRRRPECSGKRAHRGPAARRPRAARCRCRPSCPAATSPADRAVAEWVVRAPRGHAPGASAPAPTAPARCTPRSAWIEPPPEAPSARQPASVPAGPRRREPVRRELVLVAARPPQEGRRWRTGSGRIRVSTWWRISRRNVGYLCVPCHPARQGGAQALRVDRLGQEVVHAGGQRLFALGGQRGGGQRDDRQRRAPNAAGAARAWPRGRSSPASARPSARRRRAAGPVPRGLHRGDRLLAVAGLRRRARPTARAGPRRSSCSPGCPRPSALQRRAAACVAARRGAVAAGTSAARRQRQFGPEAAAAAGRAVDAHLAAHQLRPARGRSTGPGRCRRSAASSIRRPA